MNDRKRKILLLVLAILIVLTITIGMTTAFMNTKVESVSQTDITLNSCAKITLIDNDTSINLENTAPMIDKKGMETTPYTFNIKSSCSESVNYKVYLAPLTSSTLDASNIKFAIKDKTTNTIIKSGILSSETEAISDFSSNEINETTGSIGAFTNVYSLLSGTVEINTQKEYELYLWVNKDAGNETMNKTFVAGVLAKAVE